MGLTSAIHILHLEDNPVDADLVQSMLEAEAVDCSIRRVETRDDFERALSQERYDLIVSDYSLPSFDGLSALRIIRQKCPQVPVIIFSGSIGEEAAVESLKEGAVDYVLKDRPTRFVASARRAIQEARIRAEQRRTEEELRRRDELFRRIGESVGDLIAVRRAEETADLRLQGRTVGDAVGQLVEPGQPGEVQRMEEGGLFEIGQELRLGGPAKRARYG
jgi:DNA-binding NtrC family response regulator